MLGAALDKKLCLEWRDR